MTESDVLARIDLQKARVKDIVVSIQKLKADLEQGRIAIESFKEKKTTLEDELREILKEIAEFKEKLPEKKPFPAVQISPQAKEEAEKMDRVEKLVSTAKEAKDLMYYFETEFEGSITKAKVYLSITINDHFVIDLDYSSFPDKPVIALPPNVLRLFNDSEEEFFKEIPEYTSWDSDKPSRLFEIIGRIENALVKKFEADVKSIEERSIQFVDSKKKHLETLIQEARQAREEKNIERTVDFYYEIVDMAYDLQDKVMVEKYTKELELLLKRSKEKRKK